MKIYTYHRYIMTDIYDFKIQYYNIVPMYVFVLAYFHNDIICFFTCHLVMYEVCIIIVYAGPTLYIVGTYISVNNNL